MSSNGGGETREGIVWEGEIVEMMLRGLGVPVHRIV
jgi:hypothetical protein